MGRTKQLASCHTDKHRAQGSVGKVVASGVRAVTRPLINHDQVEYLNGTSIARVIRIHDIIWHFNIVIIIITPLFNPSSTHRAVHATHDKQTKDIYVLFNHLYLKYRILT